MRTDDQPTPCLSKVPDYEVRDGIMYIKSGEWGCCIPLRLFKLGLVKAEVAIAKYESERGEVISFQEHRA